MAFLAAGLHFFAPPAIRAMSVVRRPGSRDDLVVDEIATASISYN
jgi:hypothetical protein